MNTRIAIVLALSIGTSFVHAAGKKIEYPSELIGKYAPLGTSCSDAAKAAKMTDIWTGITIAKNKSTIEHDTCKPTDIEAFDGGFLIAERCEGVEGDQTKRTIKYIVGGNNLTTDDGKTSTKYTKCGGKT